MTDVLVILAAVLLGFTLGYPKWLELAEDIAEHGWRNDR